eukprot:Lankesteria_metandrocarpae@DN5268_c0_g1_i1.p1
MRFSVTIDSNNNDSATGNTCSLITRTPMDASPTADGSRWDSIGTSANAPNEDRQQLLFHLDMPTHGSYMQIHPDRLNMLLILQTVSLMLKSVIFSYLIIFFARELTAEPPGVYETWSVVWMGRIVVQSLMDVIMLFLRRNSWTVPRVTTVMQSVLFVFGLGWFLYGTRILYFPQNVTNSTEVGKFWASIFWWYQGLSFLIPCTVYLMICLCLPCLILAIVRVQVPFHEQRPTPQNVIDSLEVKSYGDLVTRLRREYTVPSPGGTAPPTPPPPVRSLVPGGAAIVENINAAFGFNTPAPVGIQSTGGECWNNSCPICMLDLEYSDQVSVMPCDDRHFFHKACVEQWLRSSQVW